MWPFSSNKKPKSEPAKKGDTIKCIDDREWNRSEQTINLQYGKKYKVLDIIKLSCCGGICYDIGSRFADKTKYTSCTCSVRRHDIQGSGIHWAADFRFAKSIEESAEESVEELEKRIAEAVKAENYELAGVLHNKIKN